MPDASAAAPVLMASACALIVLAAWHVWYSWGLARVFAAHGAPTWRAWVPVLREAELFRLGSVDPVKVVLLLVPFVAVYGFVLRVMAVHRIGVGYGRGAGMTALGAVLPPVWATLLADARPVPAGADAAADVPAAPVPAPAGHAASSRVPAAPSAPAGAAPAPVMHVPAPPAPASTPTPAPIMHMPAPAPAPAPPAPAASAPPALAAPPAAPASAPTPAAPDDVDEHTHVVSGVREWELLLPDGTAVVLVAEDVVLGRRPFSPDESTQAVAVPDHTRTVSKQHARLAWSGDGWTITDLGSTNGVSLLTADGDEQEIESGTPVPLGEAFLLGEYRLALRRDGV
ncbi:MULTISPECIES: FHA domain-containing protein [unclassified Microbacterium]|uniref:FHA domain-containing protein n=1 Tax=unclassified Microbacterium TaxID=2609290 RepID=UPI00214CD978|nr:MULTISPECIES: FHA domain-containing protein [unclassified Microbacterium]MCR2784670.1 FHA domain-containing protein [Microbacterium sp. zg.B96]MDL5352879.1 FHA domain-containing protein [Microbacterium sp. zg-YB36]WIM16211.1 FHA domain-containing protein [Microbacterium sp. zg-B96]